MRNKTVDAVMFFAACLVVVVLCWGVTSTITESFAEDQSKMEVKTVYRIVYFECGKHKFRVGDGGVSGIGISKEQPGMWIVEFDDGRRTIVLPTETVLITEEEQTIVVPKIVMADGTSKAQ